MDAVEYLKEAKGMCDTVGDCRECPLNSSNTVIPCKLVRDNWELTNPEKIVAIVEKWALEHPKKTRQSEFLKMFPNARIRGDVLEIRPCDIDDNIECIDGDEECYECYRKYWLAEVE